MLSILTCLSMESLVRVVGTIRILSEKHWVVMCLMSHRKIPVIQPNRYAIVTNMDCSNNYSKAFFSIAVFSAPLHGCLLPPGLGLKRRTYDYNYKWSYKKSFVNEFNCR